MLQGTWLTLRLNYSLRLSARGRRLQHVEGTALSDLIRDHQSEGPRILTGQLNRSFFRAADDVEHPSFHGCPTLDVYDLLLLTFAFGH